VLSNFHRLTRYRFYLDSKLRRRFGRESEVYRFVWHRSFHLAAVIRIGRIGKRVTLRAKYLEFLARGEQPSVKPKRRLTMADWDKLQTALAAADFWNLPECERPRGLDGATWTVEGCRGETYHQSTQWSPDGTKFADLGVLFIRLAELPVPDDEIY
jgi:hypothetical protein